LLTNSVYKLPPNQTQELKMSSLLEILQSH